jgi:hypothetical protein
VSGAYHSASIDGYQLRITVLIIKIIQLIKDNIRKGATMQPITINQQYPTRTYIIHHMQNKIIHVSSTGATCTGASLAHG